MIVSGISRRHRNPLPDEVTMPFRSRSIAREISSAAAVIAVYVLVLLTPLHQASGLQRYLAELGHASSEAWSICGSTSPGDEEEAPSGGINCPIIGIGKQALVGAQAGSVDLDNVLRVAIRAGYPDRPAPPRPTVAPHVGQARAPPVMV